MSSVHRIRVWPWVVPLCAGLLMLAGLAGIARGDELATGGRFLPRQLLWIGISVPALLGPLCLHYRRLRRASYAFMRSRSCCSAWFFSVLPGMAREGGFRWESPTFSPRN